MGFFGLSFGGNDQAAPTGGTGLTALAQKPDRFGLQGFKQDLKSSLTDYQDGLRHPLRDMKDDLTGETDRRLARQQALKHMLGAPLPTQVGTVPLGGMPPNRT